MRGADTEDSVTPRPVEPTSSVIVENFAVLWKVEFLREGFSLNEEWLIELAAGFVNDRLDSLT